MLHQLVTGLGRMPHGTVARKPISVEGENNVMRNAPRFRSPFRKTIKREEFFCVSKVDETSVGEREIS